MQSVLILIGAATVQTLSRPAELHVRTQHDLRDWLCMQPTTARRGDRRGNPRTHPGQSRPPNDALAGLLE